MSSIWLLDDTTHYSTIDATIQQCTYLLGGYGETRWIDASPDEIDCHVLKRNAKRAVDVAHSRHVTGNRCPLLQLRTAVQKFTTEAAG